MPKNVIIYSSSHSELLITSSMDPVNIGLHFIKLKLILPEVLQHF